MVGIFSRHLESGFLVLVYYRFFRNNTPLQTLSNEQPQLYP